MDTQALRDDADEIEACGGGNEAARLRLAAAEIKRLRAAMQLALDASTIELNLGNYDHDEVCVLQGEAIEIWRILTDSLAIAEAK
jgi:hypothetical protein